MTCRKSLAYRNSTGPLEKNTGLQGKSLYISSPSLYIYVLDATLSCFFQWTQSSLGDGSIDRKGLAKKRRSSHLFVDTVCWPCLFSQRITDCDHICSSSRILVSIFYMHSIYQSLGFSVFSLLWKREDRFVLILKSSSNWWKTTLVKIALRK